MNIEELKQKAKESYQQLLPGRAFVLPLRKQDSRAYKNGAIKGKQCGLEFNLDTIIELETGPVLTHDNVGKIRQYSMT